MHIPGAPPAGFWVDLKVAVAAQYIRHGLERLLAYNCTTKAGVQYHSGGVDDASEAELGARLHRQPNHLLYFSDWGDGAVVFQHASAHICQHTAHRIHHYGARVFFQEFGDRLLF
jgi:hypothetical protein